MNLLKGQIIEWTEKVFLDHGKNAIFCGERTNTGLIIKESYGDKRGQHTFTILIQDSKGYQALSLGKNVCRKGRNLYRTAKIIKDVSDKMIEWKSKGTELYQKLPAELYATLKPCEPLREIPANLPKQQDIYKTWKRE